MKPAETSAAAGRFLRIDDEGYLASQNIRWSDASLCQSILKSLRVEGNYRYIVTIPAQAGASATDVIVEPFDQPLVATHIQRRANLWYASFPYNIEYSFALDSLSIDEWDRFHGRNPSGLPFVFSRNAQNDFFNLVTEFEDDGFTVDGKFHTTQPWLTDPSKRTLAPGFWEEVYTAKPLLPWELPDVHPALVQTFKQMKFNRSRIAVLGSGGGHDAAWLARQGHMVTAFDFAADAIHLSKERYKNIEGLKFEQADVLNLPPAWNERFDIVFDHTLYCAIPPQSRADLVKVWRRLLVPTGHTVSIHFIMDRAGGPPYGATEWELRQRLQSNFSFLYWSRWQAAEPASRLGTELVIVAQDKTKT